MPRSMPALAVIPAMEIMSMYSTRSGPTPLATTGATAPATSSMVAKGASRVDWWSGRGWRRRIARVTRANVPSDPMTSWVRS